MCSRFQYPFSRLSRKTHRRKKYFFSRVAFAIRVDWRFDITKCSALFIFRWIFTCACCIPSPLWSPFSYGGVECITTRNPCREYVTSCSCCLSKTLTIPWKRGGQPESKIYFFFSFRNDFSKHFILKWLVNVIIRRKEKERKLCCAWLYIGHRSIMLPGWEECCTHSTQTTCVEEWGKNKKNKKINKKSVFLFFFLKFVGRGTIGASAGWTSFCFFFVFSAM